MRRVKTVVLLGIQVYKRGNIILTPPPRAGLPSTDVSDGRPVGLLDPDRKMLTQTHRTLDASVCRGRPGLGTSGTSELLLEGSCQTSCNELCHNLPSPTSFRSGGKLPVSPPLTSTCQERKQEAGKDGISGIIVVLLLSFQPHLRLKLK